MLHFDDYAVLSFDCYGTLIDWESGLWQALEPILANHQVALTRDAALELFAALESEAERGDYREYKTVLHSVLAGFGIALGFEPSPAESEQFATSVRNWPAFPDSVAALQALARRFRLAVISNIDDDLFASSAERLGARFDWVITAQQARSYKPSLNNFRLALARIGLPQSKVLHVAQSLYHDIAPAKTLGLATVWVNRRHAQPGSGATLPAQATPDLEVPDLQTLAQLAGAR